MLHFAQIARTSLEMREKFRFLAKNARNGHFLSKSDHFLPKMPILPKLRKMRAFMLYFARIARTSKEMHAAIFAPKVAIFRALCELRKKCAQSFGFWPKMPENGHFCPKLTSLPKRAKMRAFLLYFAHIARTSQEMR